jgi:hypothetical protein
MKHPHARCHVLALLGVCLAGCGSSAGAPAPAPPPPDAAPAADVAAPAAADGAAPSPDAAAGVAAPDVAAAAAAAGSGPNVDRTTPQARAFMFKASEADPRADKVLGSEQAFLDTQVAPLGKLVVHLHGQGGKTVCGYADHGRLLASWGFHVFMPCYDAGATWNPDGCGNDIGACRLEAFDGVDHHPGLSVQPPQAIEVRVVKALEHLTKVDPGGDWGYYLDGDKPRWSRIIISGQSFGAATAPVIAMNRLVDRSVSLSGPREAGATWLKGTPLTPIDRFYIFTHVNDDGHAQHLQCAQILHVAGMPTNVEMASPPYGGSHLLVGAQVNNAQGQHIDGHNATEARAESPKDGGKFIYEPVWRTLYGVP